MRILVPILFILFMIVGLSACTPADNPTATPTPADSIQVEYPATTIHGAELSESLSEEVKEAIRGSVIPYQGVTYDSIDISVENSGDALSLRVISTSTSCEYPDLYDFTYHTDTHELIQTGYILEAIPPGEKSVAITIAFRDEQVRNLFESGNLGSTIPTVRRVLPETSAKFYLPKTLLSVTWITIGEDPITISVLLDPDEKVVIQTWTSG